jgi:aminopeptidase N
MRFVDPHSFSDIEQGTIEHVDFRLKILFEKQIIQGECVYSFDSSVHGPLFLDVRDLTIQRIHIGGKELKWTLDKHDEIKGSRLHIEDLGGASSCTIEYATSPSASALQWLEPLQTTGGEHPFLYSQSQPIHARSIFPCQDTPTVRFTFTAAVEVQRPLSVVMGASRISSRSGNTNHYSFDMPQRIPSYLFAIAAGDIEFSPIGNRCGVYSEPQLLEAATWEFSKTEEMLDIAERLFGPYEWDRYDILILPPAFPYGGMENPRLTFLNPMFIIGDRSETIIVTHELAHAWTGNLVTNATWEDFWLNEGWTTYAQSRITEELEGREYSHFRAALSRNFMFEDMRRFGMESKYTRLNYSMEGVDPDDTFSTIPYHKGSAFITLLEETIGREGFDEFIRKYIAIYRFKSLTTQGFIDFLCDQFPEIGSQVNLQEWLHEPGFPDDAPPLRSKIYDNIVAFAEGFKKGDLPTDSDVSRWKSAEKVLFLRLLPTEISVEQCRYLEALFNFKQEQNPSPLAFFYIIALLSGYEETWVGIEKFSRRVGRGLLVNRIYRAMVASSWARDRARPLFEETRPRLHPLTVAGIEGILSEAGL